MKIHARRIFIPITFEGKARCEAVVDTGSEVTLVNVARVTLPQKPKILGTTQLEGAFVGGMGMQQVILPALEIGTHARKNVPLGLIRQDKGQALEAFDMVLGMDTLRRMRFTLDFAHKRFVIWPHDAAWPKPEPHRRRHEWRLERSPVDGGRRPWTRATVNGKDRRLFLIDSASDTLLYPAFKPLKDLGLVAGRQAGYAGINDGGRAVRVSMYHAPFERVTVGRLELKKVAGKVMDAHAVSAPVARRDLEQHYSILGFELLARFAAVHFDSAAGKIFVETTVDAQRALQNADPTEK